MADIEKEVKSFNGTVIGNPTLDLDTGIVSGFSINDYLLITDRQSYGTGTIASFEAVFKIHTPTANNWTTSGRVINGTSAHDDLALDVTSSASTFRFIDADYTNNKLLTVAGALSSDTDYWMKITYDGTTLTGYLSTDGISYTQQGSLTRSSSELYITGSPYTMGSRYDNPAVCVWNGSIDLSETYINVNGVRWWTPIDVATYYGQTEECYKNWPYLFGARGVGYYDSAVSKVPTANEDILLTMKNYDGLTETYTEGIGTAGKVDFTGTILPWKWDYNSGLDVSKYCLMPSGFTYENIDTGDKERHFNVIGSPTIDDSTGIISGFSTSNYLKLPTAFNPSNNPWEWNLKVTTGNNFSSEPAICGFTADQTGVRINISSTGNFVFLVATSSWINIAQTSYYIGTYVAQTNTTYWLKCGWTGTQYYFEYSLDGVTYTRDITAPVSTAISSVVSIFGTTYANNTWFPWNGSIDFSETYIKINGVETWRGFSKVLSSLPGCTYNFTDDGSATTLNAFAVQGDKNIVLTPDVEYYGNRYLGTVEIPQHDVYQYNNGTWQNAPYLIGGHTYYFKMIGGGGGSSTWEGGAGAYWEGYYTPTQTVAVTLSQGGGGSGAGAYSRRHNGVKGGTTSLVGEGVSIVCEGGQGAIGLRNGDETGNSSTYTYAPTITITNGTYETIKASTHYRPRRISWDDDTVTGYGAGGQAASGTKAPGNDGLAGYLEYYQVGTITINPTPADALVEMSLDGIEYTTTSSLIAKVGETVYYRVSKEGYISEDTSVLVEGNETINVELMEEPQP